MLYRVGSGWGFCLLPTANRLVLGGALGGEGRGREQVAVVGALRLDGGAGLEPTGQVTTVADEHRGVAVLIRSAIE